MTMDTPRKSMLIVARHSPYGGGPAQPGLDLALAAAAFEQDVALLFLGDGVQQLRADQDGHLLGVKTIGKQLASLPLYDVSTVYADSEAAQRLGVDLAASPVPVQALDPAACARLLASYDHVLGF